MSSSTLQPRIVKLIGQETFSVLEAYTKDKPDMLQAAKLVFEDVSRFPDNKPLMENVIMAMVKTAIQSHTYRPTAIHEACKTLIKSLGLDEATREFMFSCLLDQGGLDGPSIRVFRSV